MANEQFDISSLGDVRPDVSEMITIWDDMDLLERGARAARAHADRFIAVSPRMPREDAAWFRSLPTLYPAVAHTLRGLVGVIMRKAPVVSLREPLASRYAVNADLDGRPITALSSMMIRQQLLHGRSVWMVDVPRDGGLPYLVTYPAHSLIDYRVEVLDDGSRRLVEAILELQVPDPTSGKHRTTTEYRRLYLADGTTYKIEVYRKDAGSKHYGLVETIVPMRGEMPLDFIPLLVAGASEVSFDIQQPPLLPLGDEVIAHFRISAHLEAGRIAVGCPIIAVIGEKLEEPIYPGWSRGLNLSTPGADVKLLEARGDGLGALERAVTHREETCAILGARLLEPRRDRAGETATSVNLRARSESSVLGEVASTASQAMTQLARWATWWHSLGIDERPEDFQDVTVEMNRDYYTTPLSEGLVRSLLLAVQAGSLSQSAFTHAMYQGELLPPGRTPEEEQHLLDAESKFKSPEVDLPIEDDEEDENEAA